MKWNGRVYEIQYPPLIDPDMALRVHQRREKSKGHPARNVKYDYLGLGVVHCAACNVKMSSFTTKAYKNGKPTNRMVREYRCGHFLYGYHSPGCPHRISVKRLDEQLWQKVWLLLSERKNLEEAVEGRLEELRHQEIGVQSEIDRIHAELDKIIDERQWVVTQARKRTLTEDDMEYQLGILDSQEKLLKLELADKNLLVGDRGNKLLEFIEQYRKRLATGLDWLQSEPQTPKAAEKRFKARRKIVEAIVSRVDVFEDKSIKVEFVFDLSEEEIKQAPPWWR
jgi:glutaredoxin